MNLFFLKLLTDKMPNPKIDMTLKESENKAKCLIDEWNYLESKMFYNVLLQ